jgi:hypothetical protein
MISEYYGKCEERIEKELEAGDREEEEGRRGTSGGSEADSGDRPRRGTRSRELERELTKHVLELATLLEAQARGLLGEYILHSLFFGKARRRRADERFQSRRFQVGASARRCSEQIEMFRKETSWFVSCFTCPVGVC